MSGLEKLLLSTRNLFYKKYTVSGDKNGRLFYRTPFGSVYGVSKRGQRKENQDGIIVLPLGDRLLAGVADGLGGHSGGALASKEVLDTIVAVSLQGRPIFDAIVEASERLNAYDDGRATTLTLAEIKEDKALIYHIGDSRAYKVNKEGIEPLTPDHNYMWLHMLDIDPNRDYSEFTLKEKRKINRIYSTCMDNTIGCGEVVVETYAVMLKKGDRLVLSSDGVHDNLIDEEIRKLVRANQSIARCGRNIVKECIPAPVKADNVSVVVYEH